VLDQQVTETFPTNPGSQTPPPGHVEVIAGRRVSRRRIEPPFGAGTRWLPQYHVVKTNQAALPHELEDILRRASRRSTTRRTASTTPRRRRAGGK
jgi:hypothetical protein